MSPSQSDFDALVEHYKYGLITRAEFLTGAECFLPRAKGDELERIADQVVAGADTSENVNEV